MKPRAAESSRLRIFAIAVALGTLSGVAAGAAIGWSVASVQRPGRIVHVDTAKPVSRPDGGLQATTRQLALSASGAPAMTSATDESERQYVSGSDTALPPNSPAVGGVSPSVGIDRPSMSSPEIAMDVADAGMSQVVANDETPQDAGVPQPEESEEPEVGPPCGSVTCAADQVCCNESCGICAAPGERCDQRTCGMSYLPFNMSCGRNTCKIGQVCCNESCGICKKPGEPCDQRVCMNAITTPRLSESCGRNTCNIDEVCCNPSCGICKKPGEPCSRKVCD